MHIKVSFEFCYFYFSSLQDACLQRRSLPCIQSKLKSLNHREGTKRLKGRVMFVVAFQIPLSMICYHPYIPKTPNRESIKKLSNMKRPFKVYLELGVICTIVFTEDTSAFDDWKYYQNTNCLTRLYP